MSFSVCFQPIDADTIAGAKLAVDEINAAGGVLGQPIELVQFDNKSEPPLGADGATDASDAAKDDITNPAPINGNNRVSLSADDDGGYFKDRAAAYYRDGALPLP